MLPDVVPADAAGRLSALIYEVEQSLALGPIEAIAVIVGRLLAQFHSPSGEHVGLVAGDFVVDDLSEYPTAIVDEAARRWRQSSRFWPTIADLRGVCDGILAIQRDRLTRARFLLWCAAQHGGQVPRYVRNGPPSAAALEALMAGKAWAMRLFSTESAPPTESTPPPAGDLRDFSEVLKAMPTSSQAPPMRQTRRKTSSFTRAEIDAGALDEPSQPSATK